MFLVPRTLPLWSWGLSRIPHQKRVAQGCFGSFHSSNCPLRFDSIPNRMIFAAKPCQADPTRTEPNRTDRKEQNITKQKRTGHNKTEKNRTEWNRTEQNQTDRKEQNRPEQTRTEQNGTEQNRAGNNPTEQNRTEPNSTGTTDWNVPDTRTSNRSTAGFINTLFVFQYKWKRQTVFHPVLRSIHNLMPRL